MNQHADLVGRHIEETARFDHLEAFVHQGCRIDGDALAHLPGGMIERLLHGNVGEVAARRVEKRTAGGGQPDALDFVAAAAAHALVNGVVLAVDGQQRLALAAGFGGDEIAGGDQAFLVGQADGLAGLDRFVGGFQSGDADDGADHEVGVGMGRDLHRAGRAVQRPRWRR